MAEPTRRDSNRTELARAFTKALAEVRNGSYAVFRGPVAWGAFDFTAKPHGAAVILASSPLLDSGDVTVVVEAFTGWREQPADRKGPLEDLTLDDLYDDVRMAVTTATRARRRDGEAVLAGVREKRATVEEVYVEGIMMGIVVSIPLAF